VPYLPNLLAFAGIWTVVVISPGPDLIVITRMAVTHSRQAALAAVLGVSFGTAIWAAGAAMGLAVLFAQAEWIPELIRWCGAVYLLVLALQIFRRANLPLQLERSGGPARDQGLDSRILYAWRTGLFSDLTNPKAVVFWSSLFATTLPKGTPYLVMTIAVILAVAIAGCWYTIAAILLSVEPIFRSYLRAKRWIDYLTGGTMTSLAARLVVGD
jgi:threonine efflux protein